MFGKSRSLSVISDEILGSNSEKWKTQMSVRGRILFESVAGELLQVLGYEVEGVTRRVSAWERGIWKTHDMAATILRRLNLGHKKRWIPSHLQMRWASLAWDSLS